MLLKTDREANITGGHNLMINKEQCKVNIRKYSRSQRVRNIWNKLPIFCINSTNVNLFKNRIDKYLHKAGNVFIINTQLTIDFQSC